MTQTSRLRGILCVCPSRSHIFVLRSRGKNGEAGSRKICVSKFICDHKSKLFLTTRTKTELSVTTK
jgi:hypothetical protein